MRKLHTGLAAAVLATSAVTTLTQLVATPAASAESVGSSLAPGAGLSPGQCTYSPGNAFAFCLQTDGNVVEYGPGGALWTAVTAGRGGNLLLNQTDGNLVLYSGGTPLWSSGTAGRGATTLLTQGDGNVVSYVGSAPVWNTYTAGGVSRLVSSYVVAFVKNQLGKPYSYGAAGPSSYDCSGLAMAAYASAGVGLPHSAAAQFHYGVPVSALVPGDLVFSYSGPGHVGVYIGNGNMIDSPHAGSYVRYDPASSWGYYVGARRIA